MATVSNFGKEVGKVLREAKQRIADNPAINGKHIDPQVNEQFRADMDKLIHQREK